MNLKEKTMKITFCFSAIISILAVAIICFFLFAKGIPAIEEIGFFKFIFGMNWKPSSGSYGIFPMIVGSVYVTAGALILGVPIALLLAIYLSKFASKKVYNIMNAAIELMAGIPSIVYGFFGLATIVPLVQNLGVSGKSVLSASILLAIMILPTVIKVSHSSLSALDSSFFEGALALGATKERSSFFVNLPAAKSGIFAGVVLGIGRALGETMAVVMVAGNQPAIPGSILSGVRTLTSNIVLEMAYATELHEGALIGTGVVLFVFILIINFSMSLLKTGGKK